MNPSKLIPFGFFSDATHQMEMKCRINQTNENRHTKKLMLMVMSIVNKTMISLSLSFSVRFFPSMSNWIIIRFYLHFRNSQNTRDQFIVGATIATAWIKKWSLKWYSDRREGRDANKKRSRNHSNSLGHSESNIQCKRIAFAYKNREKKNNFIRNEMKTISIFQSKWSNAIGDSIFQLLFFPAQQNCGLPLPLFLFLSVAVCQYCISKSSADWFHWNFLRKSCRSQCIKCSSVAVAPFGIE